MNQLGKIIALAIVGSMTIITVAGIFSLTATQFIGSGDSLELDVEVKHNNVKMRAAVNNRDKSKDKNNLAPQPVQ